MVKGFLLVEHLHSNLEDPQQPQGSQNGKAKRSGLGIEVGQDHFEHAARNDEAIEPVEGRLEVNPGPQGPHPQEHFKNEEPKEEELCHICNGNRIWMTYIVPDDTAVKDSLFLKLSIDLYFFGFWRLADSYLVLKVSNERCAI